MRGYDIAVVRLLPFVLYIQIGICSLLSLNGNNPTDFYTLHNNSAIYAGALFLISLANKHYHCIWDRAMYIFLIVVPIFNYLDAKFSLVPSVELYIWIFHIAYGLTAIITAYMAVKHFIPTLKHK